MLDFQFMRHDKWTHVLFVHWSIPAHLESLLLEDLNGTSCDSDADSNDDAGPSGVASHNDTNGISASKGRFVLDRYKGRAYVGLILLTEVNVGPKLGRSIKRLLVTHHGANIRTYVRPASASNEGEQANHCADGDFDDEQVNNRGITFASLECDDAITAAGANVFGMPYKVANMERTYYCQKNGEGIRAAGGSGHGNGAVDDISGRDCQALIRNNVLSTKEVDDVMFGDEDRKSGVGNANAVVRRMSMRSVRMNSEGTQGMLGKIKSIVGGGDTGEEKHKSNLVVMLTDGDSSQKEMQRSKISPSDNSAMGNGYSLDCEWEVKDDNLTDEERGMAAFFCERYHVYTYKYKLNWKGTVTHEPWPVQKAKINHLVLENIDKYEPSHVRPLLRHMSATSPDSVLYSSGVGPVDFQMLKPV